MRIYDHAQHLAVDTGWNNCSLVHLLCRFIDESGLAKKAAEYLDAAYDAEMVEMQEMGVFDDDAE